MIGNLTGQRVAVTGASGFIGLHLLRRLHRAGAEIVAIVVGRKANLRLLALPFPVEIITVEDVDGLARAIRQASPTYVVHLSAFITTDRTISALEATTRWNLLATIAVLSACAEKGVSRVLLLGSTEEYGQNPAPFKISAAPDPPSPYAASKAAATCYANMFQSSFNLPTIVLRPSVVYGPGQSLRMLIPMVMQALAENRTIDVTEGKQTRDFVYVDDVAEAIVIALTTPSLEGDVLNVGSGEVVTVLDCLKRIEKITGKYGLIQYGKRPYKELEIFHYHPEVEESYSRLKWRPSVMLEEGLQKTWESIADIIQ